MLCHSNEWNDVSGDWTFDEHCILQQTATTSLHNGKIWIGSADGLTPDSHYDSANEFIFETTLKIESGDQVGVLFRVNDINSSLDGANAYFFGLNAPGDRAFLGIINGGWTLVFDEPYTVNIGTIYTLKVIATSPGYYDFYVSDFCDLC